MDIVVYEYNYYVLGVVASCRYCCINGSSASCIACFRLRLQLAIAIARKSQAQACDCDCGGGCNKQTL